MSVNNYEKARSLDEIVDEKALVDKAKDLIIEIGELLDKKETYEESYLVGQKQNIEMNIILLKENLIICIRKR
jgi:hypothetical protein